MKLLSAIILSGCILILSFTASAQVTDTEKKTTTKPVKTLTAKDKALIIEIFKTKDENLYRLVFSPQEIYGKMQLPAVYWEGLYAGKNLSEGSTWIFGSYYLKTGFWFAIKTPELPAKGLVGVFGKEDASRLNAIITKYVGGTK